MKSSYTFVKLAAMCTLVIMGAYAHATSYTAITNGNWSDANIWNAGVAPPAVLSGNDFVLINTGIIVTMDEEVQMTGSSIITVYGTLTTFHSLNMTSGTLNGTGAITLHTLTVGASSSDVFSGYLTVDNFYNYKSSFSTQGTIIVGDTLGFFAGSLSVGQGASLTVADEAVIKLAGGSFNNYQSWQQNGRINLCYAASGTTTMGVETTFANIQNVCVDLPATTDVVNLAGNLTVAATLSVMNGKLNMNSHNLTINGSIYTNGNGYIMAGSGTTLTINGTASTNTFAFANGNNTIGNVNINVSSAGAVTLTSDVTIASVLNIQSGKLILGSGTLTVQSAISGAGTLSGTAAGSLMLSGTGNMGTIKFDPAGATIGNVTLNATGANGIVTLGANLNVAGTLTLSAGALHTNGKHLTLSGTVAGSGTIYSDSISDLTLAGSGAMGILNFATGGDKVHDLELNTTNAGYASLGTDLSVYGRLHLISGNLNLTGANNMRLTSTDSVDGGSATSYVVTAGSGSLWLNLGAVSSVNNNRIFPIGTQANYAPIRLRNNGSISGAFSANAHAGIYANGTSGSDVAAADHGISTSWNVETTMTGSANVSVEAFWSQSMQTSSFDAAHVYLSHYTGGAWDTYTQSAAVAQANSLWSTTRTGVTSFSPFAVMSAGTTTTQPTGIEEVTENTFRAYPNPAHNVINVSVPDVAAATELTLHDMLGNEVGSYSVSQSAGKIDISSLAPGVYFVSMDSKHIQKFVKQ